MPIVTIGVYGFTEESFRVALVRADMDVFVDIRRRRGVRGHEYAFANSQRLQGIVTDLGIAYVHRLDLAAPEAAIKAQDAADRASGIRRRERDHLSDAFQARYREAVLDGFDARAFVASLPGVPQAIALFCVEGNPHACHRLLLADRLAADLGATVEHITP